MIWQWTFLFVCDCCDMVDLCPTCLRHTRQLCCLCRMSDTCSRPMRRPALCCQRQRSVWDWLFPDITCQQPCGNICILCFSSDPLLFFFLLSSRHGHICSCVWNTWQMQKYLTPYQQSRAVYILWGEQAHCKGSTCYDITTADETVDVSAGLI